MRPTLQGLIASLAVLAASACWPQPVHADDTVYACSVKEARACTASGACKVVELDEIFITPLMILDLEKKVLVSAAMDDHGRTEPIAGIQRSPKEIIAYGHGDDEVWNVIVSLENGNLTGNINSGEVAHILFGHCAPHAYPR